MHARHEAKASPLSSLTIRAIGASALIGGALFVGGCATTQASASSNAASRELAYDESSGPTMALSSVPAASESRQRLASSTRPQPRAIVTCDAPAQAPAVSCMQCPSEPQPVAVARSFYAAEEGLARCVRQRSRALELRVRAEFASQGVPMSFDVRGPGVDASEAQCLRAALCGMRVPTFRTELAVVRFEYGGEQ